MTVHHSFLTKRDCSRFFWVWPSWWKCNFTSFGHMCPYQTWQDKSWSIYCRSFPAGISVALPCLSQLQKLTIDEGKMQQIVYDSNRSPNYQTLEVFHSGPGKGPALMPFTRNSENFRKMVLRHCRLNNLPIELEVRLFKFVSSYFLLGSDLLCIWIESLRAKKSEVLWWWFDERKQSHKTDISNVLRGSHLSLRVLPTSTI